VYRGGAPVGGTLGAAGGGGGKCDQAFEPMLVLIVCVGGVEGPSFVGDMVCAGRKVGKYDEGVYKRVGDSRSALQGQSKTLLGERRRIKGSVEVEHERDAENRGGQRCSTSLRGSSRERRPIP